MDALDAVMTALHKLQGIHSPSLLAEDQQPFLEAKEALRLWLAEATATPSQRLDAATVERCAQVADTEISLIFSTTTDGRGAGVARRIRDKIRALATEPHQHGGKGA